MRQIFADLAIEHLTNDPSDPGVFMKARKTAPYQLADPRPIRLYSMLADRRIRALTPTIRQRWRWRAAAAERHNRWASYRGHFRGSMERGCGQLVGGARSVARTLPEPLKRVVRRSLRR